MSPVLLMAIGLAILALGYFVVLEVPRPIACIS